MTLLAALRRSACGIVSRSGRPPCPSLVRAAKAADAAHADAGRAWDKLFARGTPSMAGAESELSLAQYFYSLATPSLALASSSSATSAGIQAALRRATSDMMSGSSAVLRASRCLRGDLSAMLHDGASCYIDGATGVLRASETEGESAAWQLNAAAKRINAAGRLFYSAVDKIHVTYAGTLSGDGDLLKLINQRFEAAEVAKEMVEEALQSFPFEIKEKKSSKDLILIRRFEDEDIEVVVSAPFVAAISECDWDGSVTASMNDEAKTVLALQVTVSKGGSLSVLSCTAFQTEVRVDRVYMRLTVGGEDKEEYNLSFEGANSNLMLQELVHRYLELRGVTMMTTCFLYRLLSNKAVFVNIFWLELLKGFVKKSS